jgi:hypothetical protein
MDRNSNVVGGLEFLDRFQEVKDATGGADLDEFGTFLVSAPPR